MQVSRVCTPDPELVHYSQRFQKTYQALLPSSEIVVMVSESNNPEWLRLGGTFGSKPCSVRDTQSRGFRIKFSQVQRSPKVSKEHTPQPLWEIRIIAYHLHSTKMFSASQTEHLVPHLCPLPLVLALGTLKKA